MKIIGIDPGIEITGFAMIEESGAERRLIECGVIRTPRTSTTAERLVQLQSDLRQLLSAHADGLTIAGVEELFFAKNAKTAFVVGQARGVILFTLQSFGLTIEEVKPVEVKSAVVGSGNADKKEIQRMVQLVFNLPTPPQPDDAADAIAIAMTAAARHRAGAVRY